MVKSVEKIDKYAITFSSTTVHLSAPLYPFSSPSHGSLISRISPLICNTWYMQCAGECVQQGLINSFFRWQIASFSLHLLILTSCRSSHMYWMFICWAQSKTRMNSLSLPKSLLCVKHLSLCHFFMIYSQMCTLKLPLTFNLSHSYIPAIIIAMRIVVTRNNTNHHFTVSLT